MSSIQFPPRVDASNQEPVSIDSNQPRLENLEPLTLHEPMANPIVGWWNHLSPVEQGVAVIGAVGALCVVAKAMPVMATMEAVAGGAMALSLRAPELSTQAMEKISAGLTLGLGLSLNIAEALERSTTLRDDVAPEEDITVEPWVPSTENLGEQIRKLTDALSKAEEDAVAKHEELDGTVAASDSYLDAEKRVSAIEKAIRDLRGPGYVGN